MPTQTLGVRFIAQLDASIQRAFGQLQTNLNQINTSIQQQTQLLGKLAAAQASTQNATLGATNAANKFGFAVNRIAKSIQVLASYTGAAGIIYGIANAFRSGVKEIIEYDQGLKNLQAITGATDLQVLQMGETIKEVARDTKFSTAEVADGMTLIGQAGFTAQESMAAIRATANLATGTLSSMQTTADLLTTAIRAFNLEASQTSRVSDIMANAVNKSKLTIDKLRTAFNYVGATASQAGLSLEETAASMMVLANNGLRASTIGTGFRQVLSRLISPSEKLRTAFEAYGISLDKVNPAIVGFRGSLLELEKILWDNEKQAVNMQKAFQLFGLRGAQAAAILVKSLHDTETGFENMYDRTLAFGTAEEMAAKQAEGLGVKLKNMYDRAKLVAVAVGEAGLTGALGGLIDSMREFFDMIARFVGSDAGAFLTQVVLMIAAIQSLRIAFQVLRAVLTASFFDSLVLRGLNLIGVFQSLIYVLRGATGGVAMLKASLLGVMSPVGWIITAIAAVAAGLYYLNTQHDRHIERLNEERRILSEGISSLQAYDAALTTLNARKKEGGNVEKEEADLLRKLIEEHKDLASRIDITSASYEDLHNAIQKTIDQNQIASLQKEAEIIEEMRAKIDSQSKRVSPIFPASSFAVFTRQVEQSSQEINNAEKENKQYEESINALVAKLVIQANQMKVSEDRIRSWGNALVVNVENIEVAKTIVDRLQEAYKKLIETQKRVVVETASMQESFDLSYVEKEFGKLTEKNLLDFGKVKRNVENDMASITKVIEEELSRLQAIRDSYGEDEVEKYTQTSQRIEELERQKQLIRLRIYNEGLSELFIAMAKEEAEAKLREETLQGIVGSSVKEQVRARKDGIIQALRDRANAIEAEIKAEKERLAAVLKMIAAEGIGWSLLAQMRIKASEENVAGLQGQLDALLEGIKKVQGGGGGGGRNNLASQLEKQKRAAEKEVEIWKLKEEAKLEQEKIGAKGREELLREIEIKTIQLEQETNEKMLNAAKENAAKMAAVKTTDPDKYAEAQRKIIELQKNQFSLQLELENKLRDNRKYKLNQQLQDTIEYSDNWKSIMTSMYNENLITAQEFHNAMASYWKSAASEVERTWRLGTTSGEEFANKLRTQVIPALIAAGASIDDIRKYQEMVVIANGTLVERLTLGFQRAMLEAKSFGETIVQIAQEGPAQIANGFSSAFFDIIEGTKSAEEALDTFFKSVGKWVLETIIKMLILKALFAAMGMSGGGGAITGAEGLAGLFHKGGIVGKSSVPVKVVNPLAFLKAPHFETGGIMKFGKKEYPAVLHEGEGVFTPEQMAAMGNKPSGDIVNNFALLFTPEMIDAYMGSKKGKDSILYVIGSNPRTFRKALGIA